MFSKILVCSDGSAYALKAAQTAAAIALKFDAQVILLHVCEPAVQPIPMVGTPGSFLAVETGRSRPETAKQQEMEERIAGLFDDAAVRYRCRREFGHPVETIVEVAQEEQADLIVMGSRGQTQWEALLLGSVSDGVLHHAHCPVLIVR